MPDWDLLRAFIDSRLGTGRRRGERGYTWEFITITAALVAVALVIVGIIALKGQSTANGIQTR